MSWLHGESGDQRDERAGGSKIYEENVEDDDEENVDVDDEDIHDICHFCSTNNTFGLIFTPHKTCLNRYKINFAPKKHKP